MVTIKKDDLKVIFDEKDGLSILSLTYKGKEYVFLDEEKRREGRTYGIPILFPTPNRVENNSFTFNGKKVLAERHGFLRHMDLSDCLVSDDRITAEINFNMSNEYFPYDAKLTLTLSVENNNLSWIFKVENKGDEQIAYAIALHPYFKKEDGMIVSINTSKRVCLDSDCYPTGETQDCDNIEGYVSDIDTDSLFLTDGPMMATLEYKETKLIINTSDEFKFAVLYTSPSWPFICVEPQSSLTNAHNMYQKGYEKLSSLIILNGKETKESKISFCFEEK